jgi:oligoribonuclease NrnB/cAMP/cGMP phosphodiesterase (DHH superfamily)
MRQIELKMAQGEGILNSEPSDAFKVGFFHRADVDGIFSAAIFLTTHPSAKIFFTNYGKDETLRLCRLIKNIARESSVGRMVVADINLSDAVAADVVEAVRFAKSKRWKILWLDHHRWDPKVASSLRSVASMRIDTTRCASELVWSNLAPKNRTARKLAQIAHVIDLGIKQPGSGAMLTDLITCYNQVKRGDSKLVKLASQISQGILWTLNENDPWRVYVKVREKKIERLTDTMRVYRVRKLKIAIGMSDEALGSTKACGVILAKSNADIAISFNPTGKISLRRKEGVTVPLNKIAHAINPLGGGHEFAAGSFLPFRVRSKYDVEKARRTILNSIREVT